MTPTPEPDRGVLFQVADKVIDTQGLRIRPAGAPDAWTQLEPRTMALLEKLIADAPGVITRQELAESVWVDVIVSDGAISQAMAKVRRALDEGAGSRSAIQTIPKIGYRLEAEVTRLDPAPILAPTPDPVTPPAKVAAAVDVQPSEPSPRAQPRRVKAWWLAGAGLAFVIALLYRPGTTPHPEGEHAAGLPPAEMAIDSPGATSQKSDMEIAAPMIRSTRSLVSRPESDRAPVLSPDGKRAAFSGWNGETESWDLFLVDLGGGESQPLVTSPGNEFDPTFSPDGANLAYVYRDRRCQVWIIDIAGAEPRDLATCQRGLVELVWSPDGQSLVLSDTDAQDRHVTQAISEIRISDGQRRRLSPEDGASRIQPAFSPDGRLFYVRRKEMHTFDIVEWLADGSERLIYHRIGNSAGLTWDSGSGYLLVAASRTDLSLNLFGTFELLWIHPESGESSPAVVPAEDTRSPHIAAGRVAFGHVVEDFNIRQIAFDPASAEDVAGNPMIWQASSRHDFGAEISPSQPTIAFISNRSGRPELWLQNLDERQPRRAELPPGLSVQAFAWAPDGKVLALSAVEGDQFDLFRFEPSSESLTRLTDDPYPYFHLSWDEKGEAILATTHRSGPDWQIWKIPVDGQRPHSLLFNGTFHARELPDDLGWILSPQGHRGLFLEAPSGERRRLVERTPLGWTVVGDFLYSVELRSGEARLSRREWRNPATDIEPEVLARWQDSFVARNFLSVDPELGLAWITTRDLERRDLMVGELDYSLP